LLPEDLAIRIGGKELALEKRLKGCRHFRLELGFMAAGTESKFQAPIPVAKLMKALKKLLHI
jgi:hypothetical protein